VLKIEVFRNNVKHVYVDKLKHSKLVHLNSFE
jgi:hypothetical protein